MSKIRNYQQQVQDLVEKGINTVEKQHKNLAELPFELAEKVEKQAKSYSVASVHTKHDCYANTAYETLRVWNKRLGDYADNLINRFDSEATQTVQESEQESSSKTQSGGQKQASGAKKNTGGASKQAESQASA